MSGREIVTHPRSGKEFIMKSGRFSYGPSCAGILLAIPAILLALCAGPADSAPEPGAVTVVVAMEPQNLDPHDVRTSSVSQVLMGNVVEALTEMNPADSSIMPRLALSWKQVDATTWHFFLRKGVKFHDGKDFNAEAAVSNIKRMYDKRIDNTVRTSLFQRIKMESKAVDSHTLELKLDKPEPLLPTHMASLAMCSPSTPTDRLVRNPVGTGPYKLAKWDAGTQIVYERFDGYWGKQPVVKKATFVWRAESSVRAAMVAIGEADLAPEIAAQDATNPELDRTFVGGETAMLRIYGIEEPPLNDRRVRLAMNYAVDRNGMRGTILSKDVIPASQLIVPSTFGYNPDLKPYPYDPQKARALLDEARKAGVPVDREILMVSRIQNFPASDELMEALLTMYKAVGLNVKLRIVEAGPALHYRVKPYVKVGPYTYLNQHGNKTGDAAYSVYLRYHCEGQQSSTCDKRVDDLIEKAQVATGETRKTLWQTVLKIVNEEHVPDVNLFHMVGYSRIGKRINFKPSFLTPDEVQVAQITFK
jgi:peptide/nickel transport system substrate-binding protein